MNIRNDIKIGIFLFLIKKLLLSNNNLFLRFTMYIEIKYMAVIPKET